jgi:HSP20 family protein
MMTMYVSPYRRVARMREAMNRLLEENMGEMEQVNEREMLLAVDVQAEDEAYVIKALVPGLEADDIDVEILNNTVSIRGEFGNIQSEEAKYLMCELPAGRFSRVITLPTVLDPAKAEANLRNGVFSLRIPKAEAHRPKVIKVKAE